MSSSQASWKALEHAPPASNHVRRSFTLPTRPSLRSASTPPASASSDGIETLFVCSNSKIVSFTATSPPRRLSPSRGASPPRSAAWTSPTERTLALGALRIYRVTASNVSFLNSGSLLHTIFPRSQCWCVDDQSVFVLRIRQDSYYRIELPYETDEEKETITHFISALRQVLQYEKTQCPFKRGFDVDLPDRPKSPPRKPMPRKLSQSKAKKWTFDKTWVPENGLRPSTPVHGGSDAGTVSSYDEDDRSSVFTDSSEVVPESPETVLGSTPPRPVRRLSVAERASMFQGLRSVTAPVGSSRATSTMSMNRIPEESPKKEEKQHDVEKPILERHVSEADSLTSSADSFYSLETSTDHNPSTPFLDTEGDMANPWAENAPTSKGEEFRGRSAHRRQVSEMTVRVPSVDNNAAIAPVTPTVSVHSVTAQASDGRPSSAPSTPPLISDSDDDSVDLPGLDVATPPDAIRMKRLTGASQRRAFSPMPQPKNLFIPPKQTIGKQFTQALVRKTMELVLGPPAHLVSLMLRIAASISNGFGFSTYRVRQEKPPGSWESDDEDDWPEDDFGIPLTNLGESAHRRQTFSGELD